MPAVASNRETDLARSIQREREGGCRRSLETLFAHKKSFRSVRLRLTSEALGSQQNFRIVGGKQLCIEPDLPDRDGSRVK